MNATNGRHLKPPVTYLKIKEAMSNRIWCKGINRESCQTGRDPYSWTPDGSRITKRKDGYLGTSSSYAQSNAGSGPSGSKKSKGPNPPKKRSNKGKQEFCRGYNSAAGCNFTSSQCRQTHVCRRSIDSNRICPKYHRLPKNTNICPQNTKVFAKKKKTYFPKIPQYLPKIQPYFPKIQLYLPSIPLYLPKIPT